MLPETKDQRGIIYDVFCTTDTGEHIIVEMQNKSQAYFIDRSLFYASKTIVDQGVKGQWDYHLTQGGRIKMRSPPKVLTGNFRPSQLSFFLS